MIPKPLRQRLEALAARAVWALFGALPLDVASGLAGWVGRTIGPRLKVTRVARRNLRAAFPDKDAAAIEAIVTEVWDNLGRVAGEFPHMRQIAAERFEIVGIEHMHRMRDDGLPGIYVSAHLGNWEVSGAVSAREGLPVHLVYRAANNPWVEGLYREARAASSFGLIRKGAEGARQVLQVLKSGGHLGILVDQKMNDGIPVPFFGRDAMTAPAVAQFAVRHNCPLFPTRVERLGGAHFRLVVYPPLEVTRTGDRHQDILRLMTAINAMVESWVRERPGQWLWLHKRWPESL